MLLNPTTQTYNFLDPKSRELMLKTIAFFENKGKQKLKEDDRNMVWNYDFVEFLKKEQIFATLMTLKKFHAALSVSSYSIICWAKILFLKPKTKNAVQDGVYLFSLNNLIIRPILIITLIIIRITATHCATGHWANRGIRCTHWTWIA